MYFVVPMYRNKNTICINKHTNTCFLCNKSLGSKRSWDYHHILRIPAVTIRVHKSCHTKIENSPELAHLRPNFRTVEVDYIKWAYEKRELLKELFVNTRSMKHITCKIHKKVMKGFKKRKR